MENNIEEWLAAIIAIFAVFSPYLICGGIVLVLMGKANIFLVLAGVTAALGGVIVAIIGTTREKEQEDHVQK